MKQMTTNHSKQILVGSDFSGVGAFNQALIKLKINYNEIFACDIDKYARETFIHNYGEPKYFPKNVYDRKIPNESLDIYMTSPPCQAFSMAGKRLGKKDQRGILFFNSYEFIKQNKPRYFIFENVKGLISHENGNTFNEWVNLLGGKSVNGSLVMFPFEDSLPYHIYYKVLNARDFGIPQNRERVFIIGIRDDKDNNFNFPAEEVLNLKLKDILEFNVDSKYYLSEKSIKNLVVNKNLAYDNTIQSICTKLSNDNQYIKIIGNTHPSGNGMNGNVFDENGIAPTITTNKGEGIKIKSAIIKGYEEAHLFDSIRISFPNSKTKRGRVGKEIAQTLDTGSNLGVCVGDYRTDEGFRWRKDGNCPAILASMKDKFSFNFGADNPPVIKENYTIRRLTPRECFRLMGFPDSFSWTVSDSQAYKQAGNSIVVNVLAKIIQNLKF